MSPTLPRLITGRSLSVAVTAIALGMVGLALVSTDALLDRGFARAMANANGSLEAAGAAQRGGHPPTLDDNGLWLTRLEPQSPALGLGHAKIGQRLTLAVDGGRSQELEVVSIAEFSVAPATVDFGASTAPLVLVTCREVVEGERPGRLVRMIVEADGQPLPNPSGVPPARAL